MKRYDNPPEDPYVCQAECWGRIPSTILIDDDDNTCCGDCEYIIQTFDGEEPEHDPDTFSDVKERIETMGVEPRTDKQFYEGY